MTVSNPLVSVTLITYNHEKFIGQAIQSALDQTHKDLEVVLVNDGSTDGTSQVINSFTDPRLRVHHQENQGPSMAANRVLSMCRGRYIAMMSGDDMLPPDRIAKQLAEYRKGGSRILFSNVEFIDDDNNPTHTDYYASNLTPAYGRARVLRRLFDGRAPAFILTLFTETQILKAEPEYCDPVLYQLQDYDLLIRLAKKYDFAYQDDKLYRFRLRKGHANLSGTDAEKWIRTRNELYLLMRNFFEGISIELFKEMFPDLVRNPDFQSPLEYLCEQAFVLLKGPTGSLRLLGAERLYDLLCDEQAREVLNRQYGFTYQTLAETIKWMDTERQFPETQVYLDTGMGYSEEDRVCKPANHNASHFTFRFDLPKSPGLQEVRWDPVERAFCQVWLESAVWEDSQGQKVPIDVKRLANNGAVLPDGSILFGTKDPMIVFPVQGDVAALILQGRWKFNDGEKRERFRISRLYVEDDRGQAGGHYIARNIVLDESDSELTFDTSAYQPLRVVHWQPAEGGLCKVQLHSVIYRDRTGTPHTLDLTKVTSNAMQLEDGIYLFETRYPMLSLPVQGDVTSITIRGRWWGPLSQTDVEHAKLLETMRNPSRLASWIVKRGVRKLGKLGLRKRVA
jgi:glycosyltransferase involved in cell wall biosynthesis